MYRLFMIFYVLAFLLSLLISTQATVLVFIIFAVNAFILYKQRQQFNQQLKDLSLQLQDIHSGNYGIDLRDYEEGDLSILKSDIYKITTRLQESTQQLIVEKQILADALANISHQLRTPLTSLRVFTDLLEAEHLDHNTRKEFTTQVHNQLDRLQWLVTSLLKFSKLDTQTAGLKKDIINLQEVVDDVVQHLSIPIELKQQILIKNESDATFIGDKQWTIEAVLNILKNAVEHTPVGGQLSIKISENPIYSQIEMSDNGNGISPSDIPHLFKRFYRGSDSSTDSVGIGLALSYSIMRQQNGDITVKSEQGKGSTFYLKFYKTNA